MNNPLFRPPAEAYSLILQIDQGCPWNHCTFCGMYKEVPFSRRSLEEIERMIRREAAGNPNIRRIFLADGDPMRRPFEDLFAVLSLLSQYFPNLSRVNIYATGSGILDKTPAQLEALRKTKLHTLYLGLESGDEATLRAVKKGETCGQMVEACLRAQDAGLHMSIMVLLGLAGTARSREHAAATAEALNRIQPRLLSCLRIVPVPGTGFHRATSDGTISQLSEYDVIRELRDLVERLEFEGTVFRANHSSNVVPIEARFPRDKSALLVQLDQLMESGRLDRNSPGPLPLWL